jgi:hypothetical protein
MLAGWPKRRDMLARGIQAIALRAGAQDLMDGEAVSANHVRLRDCHHLFPFPLLTGDGQMPGSETYCACWVGKPTASWPAASPRITSGWGPRGAT